MKTILFFAIIVILFLLAETARLLYKNHKLIIMIHNNDEENIWHTLALTDDLTGIYNRTAYNRHISEIEKSFITENMGIILFDIDNFKKINDTSGHLAGDMALKYVANTLTSVFSSPNYDVYRIGGDEFAVLARKTSEKQIIELLIKLRKTMAKDSDIRLSNGYSVIHGNINAAFKNADEMLYADKASKKQVS